MERWKKALIVGVLLILAWVFIIRPMFDDHSQVQNASLDKVNNSTSQTNLTGSVAGSQQRGNSNVYAPIIIHSGDTRTYNYPDSSRQTGTGYTTGQRGAGYSSVPPPDREATPVTAEQAVTEKTPITAEQAVGEKTPITAEQAVTEKTPITAEQAVGDGKSSVSGDQPATEVAESTGLGSLISEALKGSGDGAQSEQVASEVVATGESGVPGANPSEQQTAVGGEESDLSSLISEVLGGGSGLGTGDEAASEGVVPGNGLEVEPEEGSNIWSDLFSGSGDAASGIDGSGDGLGGGDDDGIGGLGGLGGDDDGIFGGLGGGDDDGIGGLGGLGSDDDGLGGLGGLGDDDGFGGFGDSDNWGDFEGGDFDPGDL